MGPSAPPAEPPGAVESAVVRWDATSRDFKTVHAVSPKRVAPETGVLLHFKCCKTCMPRRATRPHAANIHGAVEYRRYAQRLDPNPRTTFMDEKSVRFEDTSSSCAWASCWTPTPGLRSRTGGFSA